MDRAGARRTETLDDPGAARGAVGVSAKMWGYSPTRKTRPTPTPAPQRAPHGEQARLRERGAGPMSSSAPGHNGAGRKRRSARVADRAAAPIPAPAGTRAPTLSRAHARVVTPMFTERAAASCNATTTHFPAFKYCQWAFDAELGEFPHSPPRSTVFNGRSFRASIARHTRCVRPRRAAVLLTRDTRPSDGCGRRRSCPALASDDRPPQISRAISAKHPETHGGTTRHDRC
jgi:hypothetical protein